MINILREFFKINNKKSTPIVVVSGLPRSGTSMMMQILQAGGIKSVSDNVRVPDQDNSLGYYEHERVKALIKGQYDCLDNAKGCAIKVVSTLLKHLPADQHYKIIFMHRDIDEVIASQAIMLKNLKQPVSSEDDDIQLKSLYLNHLDSISKWLKESSHIDVLNVNYADVLSNPIAHIYSIADFASIQSGKDNMIHCVDPKMRHNLKT